MAGTYVMHMPNGERIPVEIWVYQAWIREELKDEMLLQQFEQAEKISYSPMFGEPQAIPRR